MVLSPWHGLLCSRSYARYRHCKTTTHQGQWTFNWALVQWLQHRVGSSTVADSGPPARQKGGRVLEAALLHASTLVHFPGPPYYPASIRLFAAPRLGSASWAVASEFSACSIVLTTGRMPDHPTSPSAGHRQRSNATHLFQRSINVRQLPPIFHPSSGRGHTKNRELSACTNHAAGRRSQCDWSLFSWAASVSLKCEGSWPKFQYQSSHLVSS